MASFNAAKRMIHSGLKGAGSYDQSYRKLICSYAYISQAGWGHSVWCFDRSELGDGIRLMSYRRGAFFSGGYML